MAAIIARDEKKVLLFDAVLGLPNCDVYFGVEVGCTIGHVVRDGRELRDAILPTKQGVDLISGGSGWRELALLDHGQIDRLVESLRQISEDYDHVVIDCSTGFGERVFPFLLLSDAVMLVTSGDATSLMDGYAVLKNAWDLKSDLKAGVVINHAVNELHGRGLAKELQTVVGQFLSQPLEHWATVRHDANVLRACAERRPFADAYPTSAASQDLIDAANAAMGSLANLEVEPESESVLDKLRSVFGKKTTDEHAEAA
jgi:flagellar biosynthesis protein FlhG